MTVDAHDKNQESELNFLAVLANTNHSIRHVDFRYGFSPQEYSRNQLIRLLSKLQDLPEHEIDFKLTTNYGYPRARKIWVLVDKEKVSNDPIPWSYETWREQHALYDWRRESLAWKVKILRLLRPGDIYLSFFASYTVGDEGEIELNSSTEDTFSRTGRVLRIPRAERFSVNEFIERNPPGIIPSYIRLAQKHYDLSFEVSDTALSFISLVTSLEVLLNSSSSELRYRVCRNTAVLLGTSKQKSRLIFDKMKRLYDIRSQLVHTGACKKFSESDVPELKELVRVAIRKAIEIGKTKEKLEEKLTESAVSSPVPDTLSE